MTSYEITWYDSVTGAWYIHATVSTIRAMEFHVATLKANGERVRVNGKDV